MKNILFLTLAAAAFTATAAETPLWLRDVKISPDGARIAFTYKGDIFTVPTAGGEALRLTSQPSYESVPVWSPDGKTIAFASDRYGNFDVFAVASDGSSKEWKRLTVNSASEIPEAFTPDGREVLFSAVIQDPAGSAQFPTGRLTELYAVSLTGGAPRQYLATPARNISWAPDGKSFVYEDVKGFEDVWRKHHTSSVTRDIWRYTPSTGRHERLVDRAGEDLSPVDAGDALYFLSEREPSKSLNVYRADKGDYSSARQVTNFKTHPVRFLSRAGNGTLAFTYDGEIYTLSAGASKPVKTSVQIKGDFSDELRKIAGSRGAGYVAPSPDGKSVALTYRGDVYVTPVDYATTKQISDTPAAESDVTWGNDSTLYYTSERDGKPNIYRATIVRHGVEKDFAHATLIAEEPVFKADGHERTCPQLSPDGKKLAFILDRNKLAVMDVKSKKVTELTDGSTHRQRGGRFYYTWSPDSRWIALDIIDRKHDPYSDVAIINVADGKLTNITNSGYFDEQPKWIMDGNALAFGSERLGMRNHASWGSQSDVFFVFMNRDAYDRFMMSKEERELLDNAADKKKDKDKDKAGTDSIINVELDGISDRQVRVTPMSTDLIDFIVDKEGKHLYFISGADEGSFIWDYDLEKKQMSMERKHSERAGFDMSADGKTIFLFGNTLYKFGSSPKAISFRAEKVLDPAAERAYMFDYMAREEAERFYTKNMHGVDWPAMTAHYRRFLPHINNNYDFAELLSEILGELNVSHTGGRYQGSPDASLALRTASLGVLYDLAYTGKGVRVDEILDKGPLYNADSAMVPGAVITAINGTEIDRATQPIENLLADAAGKRTLVTFEGTDGVSHDIVVRPVSAGRQNSLLYDRWVKNRAADVDRLSKGRLGYVHIESMDDDSFRKVYSDLLGKYNDREGVVIDIRWNGGGRLHEDIEVLLSGEKYFTQEIRGEATCDMPSRRWNKPSIMVMAEACYSNAHGTPWVYSHRGLGKTVGMPVPGTMTSVNWVRMQDPTMVFGIPVVGYRLADGSFLENQQLEPDIRVENTPEGLTAGEDAQLAAAVEALLKEIDSKKK